MPHTKNFWRLPIAVQREIEERLIRSGFSGYRLLQAELQRRGFRIGRSALAVEGNAIKATLAELRDQHIAAVAGLRSDGSVAGGKRRHVARRRLAVRGKK